MEGGRDGMGWMEVSKRDRGMEGGMGWE